MDKVTKLTDVRVDTMGLVGAGANGEDFFLLKSDEPSLLDRVITAVKSAFSPAGDKMETVIEPEVIKEEVPEVIKEVVPETVAEVIAEVVPEVEKEEVVTEKEDRFAALEKAMTDQKAEIATLRESLAKSHEQNVAVVNVVLEKAFVEKAEKYDCLPIEKNEMAKHLFAMSNVVPAETMSYFESVLEAANTIAKDSGIFVEKGTTLVQEVKSIANLKKDSGKSFKETLLDMPVDVQERYLNEVHERISGK